jgi:PAS domain S-box-containing protein
VSDPRILHIEDDEAVRYVLSRVLQREGFQVQQAGTGEEGLKLARQAPDLILLDIRLPDANGFDLCKVLKADPDTSSIPVLHLTSSYAGDEYLVAGLEGGADGYLTHPVEPIVLVATIRALLRARRAEAEVRKSAQLWQTTFDAITDGVCLLDAEDRFLRCNRPMADLLGRDPQELAGTSGLPPLPGMIRPEEGWPVERARKSRRRESIELSAGDRWFEISSDPIFDEQGAFTGSVRIISDITGRKRTEEALVNEAAQRQELLRSEEAARATAEQANRLKDEFLATLSHELRTPLNAIVGWLQLLRSGTLDPIATQRAIETIERNTKAQIQLIEDVLEVSRIITGKLRLVLRPVDLAAVVRSAVETVQPGAEAKGVQLRWQGGADVAPVSGDPDRLQQVVWNLLTNAIKFTPRGGWVRVSLEPEASSIRFVVADSGQGIDPAFLPYVFDRFRQADASTTRTHGGLGLGLAIVRHIVELHGGTVLAESRGEGQGATFIVTLPVAGLLDPAAVTAPVPVRHAAVSDPGSTAAGPRIRTAPRLDGVRVLVVEDHMDTLDILVTVLRDYGAEVVAARSVDEAREVFRETRPHVLLSDIGLPGADGYELIRSIRGLPAELGGAVPAAALTAYAGQGDRKRALQAGFQAHLAKPIDPMELVAVVAQLAGTG